MGVLEQHGKCKERVSRGNRSWQGEDALGWGYEDYAGNITELLRDYDLRELIPRGETKLIFDAEGAELDAILNRRVTLEQCGLKPPHLPQAKETDSEENY